MQHSLVLVPSVGRRIPSLAQSVCRECWTGNKRGELGFGFVCLGNWLFPRMEEENTTLANLAGKRLVALVSRLSWCCLWVTLCPCCVHLHRMPWPVPVPSVTGQCIPPVPTVSCSSPGVSCSTGIILHGAGKQIFNR